MTSLTRDQCCTAVRFVDIAAPRAVLRGIRGITVCRGRRHYVAESESGVNRRLSVRASISLRKGFHKIIYFRHEIRIKPITILVTNHLLTGKARERDYNAFASQQV